LYAFLDSSLAAEPNTPRTRRVIDVDATPTSVRSGRLGNASGVKATPGSLGKRSRAAVEQDSGASNLPQWTMPLIRHICEACETPRAATHVYAGVESVYRTLQSAAQKAEASEAATPSKRRRSNGGDVDKVASDVLPMPTDEQVPALIIAVYLVTAEAMQGQARPATNKSRQRKAQSAAEAFLITQENIAIDINSKDIETYLQAAKSGWKEMEWYMNLRSNNVSDNDNGENHGADYDELSGPNTPRRRPAKTPLRRKEKHSQRKIGEEEQNPAGLLPGLGTMFQPAVDWLSEERKAEFEEWKEDLLGSVALIEQEA
jgi:origin recognition complex subunit 6